MGYINNHLYVTAKMHTNTRRCIKRLGDMCQVHILPSPPSTSLLVLGKHTYRYISHAIITMFMLLRCLIRESTHYNIESPVISPGSAVRRGLHVITELVFTVKAARFICLDQPSSFSYPVVII